MISRKETRKAYQLVLTRLMQCNLFNGKYDALNGSEDFMEGVRAVMEVIAFNAGEYNKFDKEFSKNLVDSLAKSDIIKSERGGK